MKLKGIEQLKEGYLNQQEVELNNEKLNLSQLNFDNPISGTLYGTVLNYQGEYEALESEMNEDPYKAPPQAPILYIKPINTFSSQDMPVPLPSGEKEVQIGAALGVVIGKTAKQVKEDEVFDYIEGYTIVNDVSLPYNSVYRPPIKQKARDGFCPIGPWIVNQNDVYDPHHLDIKVFINGVVRQENNTKNLIRRIPQLVKDVTDFMTLYEGDVLLVGVPENQPLAQKGDRISIEIEQIGQLNNYIVDEEDFYVSEVK